MKEVVWIVNNIRNVVNAYEHTTVGNKLTIVYSKA